MSNQNNKALAKLLRDLADQVERGDTTAYDALGPQLGAVLFERKKLQRPTPILGKPGKPEPPTIYYENNVARPLGVRRKVELADTSNQKYVSFDHNPIHLSKLAKMETLSRSLWAGKSKIYTDAIKLFQKYGFIERKGNKNVWSRNFTPLQRREFARQFYPSPAHT